MKATTRSARGVHRTATLGTFARALAIAILVAPLLGLSACRGSTGPGEKQTDPPIDTSTLIGTWTGNVDGGSGANSYGSGRLTLVLRADSTFTSTSDNPLYCSLNNTAWTVSSGNFSANGRDCTGTSVTFNAPVAPLRLNGTWTASSGRKGTFTVGRQ